MTGNLDLSRQMAKRSYGSGRLFIKKDARGVKSWYGSWWAGGVRVKKKTGLKREPGSTKGLTRVQDERELRKASVCPAPERPTGDLSAPPPDPCVGAGEVERDGEDQRPHPRVHGIKDQRLVTADVVGDQPDHEPDEGHGVPPVVDSGPAER